jgi:hypothetical protein
MATWKKVIVSGSSAELSALSLDTALPVASGGTGVSTLTDGGLVLGSGTGAVTSLGQATNGQLVIGSTGADPVLATLTGGSNITVTNTAGGISIAATGLGSGTVQSVSATGTENGITLTSDGDSVNPTITLGGALTGVTNSQLVNDDVSFGGVTVALGGADATPAFDLSDATNYPTSALVGTITNAQLAGLIANDKLVNDGITIAGNDISLGGSITAATILSGSGVVSGSDAVPNPLADGNGIADFSYDGGTAGILVAVEADGSTLTVGAGGVKVSDDGITATQIADDAVRTAAIADGDVTNAKLANDSVTIGSTEVDLGATATTLAGLSSVTSTAFTGSLIGNASTATKIASITNSNIVQLAATQALTNKDLTGAGNTFPTFNQDTTGTAATASLALSVAANSVALGTDTTGNYVATLGSGTGVTIGSNTGEGSTPTIAVDYGSTANTAVEGDTTATFAGTTNEITVSDTSAQAIGGNIALTIGLPDDVTIGQDLTVTRDVQIGRNAVISGNLTVAGTASFQNTQNLDVADRFIRMASGSTAVGDGGIVVQQDGPANGEAFAYDAATTRWSTTGSFDPSTEAYTPDSFISLVIEERVGYELNDVGAKFQKKGNIFIANDQDIFIYS